ncbi:MAG TPA: LapA family protein [Stellaceae bacterium]|nr:LapA family protein [Stellaceae bacterium]
MRPLFWGTVAAAAAGAVLFAVSNREPVTVAFWPVPYRAEVPLYLLIGAPLLLGFLLGEIAAWLGALKWRREVRRRGRQIEALERELAATQRQLGEASLDPGAALPAVPYKGT